MAPTVASRGSSSRRTRATSSEPSPRSTPASTPSTRRCSSKRSAEVGTDNAQGEKYLTDVLAIARKAGGRVSAHLIADLWQTEGVNDRVQLARLGKELNRRTTERWMREGVTIVDPDTTWIDSDATIGRDATILPGTQLLGATTIGERATIGPDTTLRDTEVGAGAEVKRTEALLAVIGPDATVGPFSYLRPGTELGAKGKIGGFVETKNAKIGDGAKVPHLTYAGDATIGEGANIGAGTIFANYDGVEKHHTTVGRHSFIGSDTVLIAPVTVADGAYVGGGVGAHRGRRAGPDRGGPRPSAQHRRVGRPRPGRHQDREGGRGGPGDEPDVDRRRRPWPHGIPTTPPKGRRTRDRHPQDHREEPHGLLRASQPRARRRGREHARHQPRSHERLRLRQR